MKIVYVTSSLPTGRSESWIVPEINSLLELGHEVMVVPMVLRGPVVHAGNEIVERSVSRPLLAASMAPSLTRNAGGLANLFGKVAKSRSAKIAVKNLAVLPKGVWLAEVAKKWKADHIHAHWASASSSLALFAHMLSGIPWSFTSHRWDIAENNLIAEKARTAKFVRVISYDGAEELAKHMPDSVQKLTVIPMGVPIPDLPVPASRGAIARLCVIANLVEKKGHVFLFRALARLKEAGMNVHLDVVGDGPLRASLGDEVKLLGLGNHVTFRGAVPRPDLMASLSKATWDALVLPSIVDSNGEFEGIPVALMEAMSFGIPVISTSTGGIPELLGDGAGSLVEQQDVTSLSEAMKRLLSDELLYARLAEAGRRRIVDRFSARASMRRMIELM